MISAFIITLLESILSKLAIGEISILYVVSVAEQAYLSMFLLETPKTPKTGCVAASRPNLFTIFFAINSDQVWQE